MEFVKPGGLDLKDRLVSIQRVTKVTKGGRAFGFSAIVIVGNEEGVVGHGLGKAKEVSIAIAKAVENDGHIYGLDPSEDQITNANVKCAEFQNITFLKSTADKIAETGSHYYPKPQLLRKAQITKQGLTSSARPHF